MTLTPRPIQDIRATRTQLAEQLRLIDSDLQDLPSCDVAGLRAERVRVASLLADYQVADQVLTAHQQSVDAERRAQYGDEADTYTPCTEEETHA